MRSVSLSNCRSLVHITWKGAAPNNAHENVPLLWLMDNCVCDACYNAGTHQRTSHIKDLHQHNVAGVRLQEQTLLIDFHDRHSVRIGVDPLRAMLHDNSNDHRTQHADVRLWDSQFDLQRDSSVHIDEPASAMFDALHRNGAVLLRGVDVDAGGGEEATARALRRLGFPKGSIFGDVWSFSANQQHADSAYSACEISLHSDGSYHAEPPGLESFHCTEFSGTGGESMIADGWAAALQLKQQDEQAYRLLTSHSIEWTYDDPGVARYRAMAPVIELQGGEGTGVGEKNDNDTLMEREILRVRYNDGDRGYMTNLLRDQDETLYARFVAALQKYYALIEGGNVQEIALRPGTILVLNNWRMMHARRAFAGTRTVVGCYHDHFEYVSNRDLNMSNKQ